jgi:hypothetical protein
VGRPLFLALLAGCASPVPAPGPREDALLDRLRAKSNAYSAFHYRAELTDGKQTVPIEMAFLSPDKGLFRYGSGYLTIFDGGVAHFFERRNYARVDLAAELSRILKVYAEVAAGIAPRPVFELGGWGYLAFGRGLRAQMTLGPGARLGWLDELAGGAREGSTFRVGQITIELREDGFIERADAGPAGRMTAKDALVDPPLDERLFALPALEGLQDISPRKLQDLSGYLEDAVHRWVLASDTRDAALETLVRLDLARRYEPDKMAELARTNLEQSLETWRRQQSDPKPGLLREKIEIDRGRVIGSVEVMEESIQEDFEKALSRYFEGMAPLPPRDHMREVAGRWRRAVARQVDLQIRRPLEEVFRKALARER